MQPLADDSFVCNYESRRESCCIKPNGDVVYCAYCNDLPMGNIRREALSKIWYSSVMQRMKKIRVQDVKGCRDCKVRAYCATGCRINAYFLNRDFYNGKDEQACQMVKFFKQNILPFLEEKGIVKKTQLPDNEN